MMRVPVNSESFGRERFWVMALAPALATAAPRRAPTHPVTPPRGVGRQESAEAAVPPTGRGYLVVAWPPLPGLPCRHMRGSAGRGTPIARGTRCAQAEPDETQFAAPRRDQRPWTDEAGSRQALIV